MLLTGKRQKNKGFLLLEAMVSISILSFGVVLVLNSFMKPIRAMEISRNYFEAGLLLEEKMLELYADNAKEKSSKGIFSDFNNKFSWELDMIESKEDFCKEVNLKILWREKDAEKDLSASTYI